MQHTIKSHLFWWSIGSKLLHSSFSVNFDLGVKKQNKKNMLSHNLFVHLPCDCLYVCVSGLVITSAAASLEGNQSHISHEPH